MRRTQKRITASLAIGCLLLGTMAMAGLHMTPVECANLYGQSDGDKTRLYGADRVRVYTPGKWHIDAYEKDGKVFLLFYSIPGPNGALTITDTEAVQISALNESEGRIWNAAGNGRFVRSDSAFYRARRDAQSIVIYDFNQTGQEM